MRLSAIEKFSTNNPPYCKAGFAFYKIRNSIIIDSFKTSQTTLLVF